MYSTSHVLLLADEFNKRGTQNDIYQLLYYLMSNKLRVINRKMQKNMSNYFVLNKQYLC